MHWFLCRHWWQSVAVLLASLVLCICRLLGFLGRDLDLVD